MKGRERKHRGGRDPSRKSNCKAEIDPSRKKNCILAAKGWCVRIPGNDPWKGWHGPRVSKGQ